MGNKGSSSAADNDDDENYRDGSLQNVKFNGDENGNEEEEDAGEKEKKSQIGRELNLHKGRTVKFDMLLASGGFSQVYLVHDIRAKERYAIKRIQCSSAEEEQAVLKEIISHKLLGGDSPLSPYILPLFDSKIQEMYKANSQLPWKEAFLLQPLLLGGSLQEKILFYPVGGSPAKKKDNKNATQNQTKMDIKDILRIFCCISEAVKTMHEVGISHRDIKPHNIMFQDYYKVSQNGNGNNNNNIPILIDLGSSVGPPLIQKVESRAQALLVQDKAEATMSAAYRAPEFYDVPSQCSLDGGKSDVFSLGCVLFAMCYYGYSPFEHPTQGIQTLAARCATYKFPDDVNLDDNTQPKPSQAEIQMRQYFRTNESVKHFIKDMLSLKPEDRPDSKEVVRRTLDLLNALDNPMLTVNNKNVSGSSASTTANTAEATTFFDTEFTDAFPSGQ